MMLSSFVFIACAVAHCINLVTSIKCYNCAVIDEILTVGYDRVITPSCSKFDGSRKYVIDCPYSTMCSRVISTIFLQKGHEQNTVTLGCAPQKRLHYVLHKGQWKEEYSVEEIYSEDCKTMSGAHLMGATKTYCYCRGDLCNSGRTLNSFINANYLLFAFLVTKIVF